MAKEFNKKYMHPTRRKLVDMVLHGKEYESNTSISLVGAENKGIKRAVGEIWTDNEGVTWEQMSYGKVTRSKLTDTMSDVRKYLIDLNKCKSESCNTSTYSRIDKKMVKKTGYCLDCMIKLEHQIRVDGLWEEYEKYRVYSNMIDNGNEILEKLKSAYDDAKQEYEYVNEDGKLEKWTLEKPVDELKAEILEDIENIKKEIGEARDLKMNSWEVLKDKGYDWIKFNDN
jgi:transcription elongation factor Elf1